jgi:flagellar basal body-associated protein FliL
MKRKRIILISVAVVVAAVLLAVHYFYLGSTVPNGQQPLARLNGSNIGLLKNAFNESADSIRVIVMLSPT